jgi:hypothetical protein
MRQSDAKTHARSAGIADPIWSARELSADAHQVELSADEHAALEAALRASAGPWHNLRRRDVPSSCAALWTRIRHCLDRSAGLCVVSGLPFPADEDSARRVAFLAALGLGTPVFQDARGARMVDIRSTDANAQDAVMYTPRSDGTHVRPYETRAAFRLHADPCDVAGLFCVQSAARGGGSTIVNALAVHQRLAETRTDLLEVLYQPFYYAKPRQPGEAPSAHAIPVFSWHDGYFKAHIVPDLIFAAQLVPELPRLSALQRDALEALLAVASSPELMFSLSLAPGQLLWLNNHLVWHGREAYSDEAGTVRHLLRLWVATPDSRPLDPVHAAWFGNPAPGALRGGYLRERLGELAELERAPG